MGGRITVESVLGQGSTFSVTVPGEVGGLLAEADDADTISLLPVQVRPLQVLLVDDNPVNLAVGTSQLERLGVDIQAAASAREALALYRSLAFDRVLMDLHMPEVDGLRATRWLRSTEGPHAVFVALTADTPPRCGMRVKRRGWWMFSPSPLASSSSRPA